MKPTVFDESKIRASFGIVSDIHIGNAEDGRDTAYFGKALTMLQSFGKRNGANTLRAVLSAGDNINFGYRDIFDHVSTVKSVYEKVFDPKEVPFITAVGNHDVDWDRNPIENSHKLDEVMGPSHFQYDVDRESYKKDANRHAVIDGVHILTVTPCHLKPIHFTDSTRIWLQNTLTAITKENPEAYILLFTHAMIADTVYGSTLGRDAHTTVTDMWATAELTDILKEFPQVMTFGGHLHFPLQDPRTVMQKDFTSFGTGSVNYMAIEDGFYRHMRSRTTMEDREAFSQGLYLEVDENDNIRVYRMDFYHGTTLGEPFVFSHPTADKKHLTSYTAARAKENTTPTLSSFTVEKGKTENGKTEVLVTFAAAEDDLFAHHYTLTLQKTGGETRIYKFLADFYRYPTAAQMKKIWKESLGFHESGVYAASLQAYDSWDAPSNLLKTVFTL